MTMLSHSCKPANEITSSMKGKKNSDQSHDTLPNYTTYLFPFLSNTNIISNYSGRKLFPIPDVGSLSYFRTSNDEFSHVELF
jgi:hypothetical protein